MKKLDWKCHTPQLLNEILLNPGASALKQPLIIFRGILAEVAQRATELNDDKLNLLMLRLTLYSCADPLCEDYDPDIIKRIKKRLKKQQGPARFAGSTPVRGSIGTAKLTKHRG